MTITIRLATGDDVTVLVPLMEAAIEQLQRGFLDDDQIESSKAIMGIDRQLIDDGTYFVVEIDGTVAGCGGWSRRATLYGGDHSGGPVTGGNSAGPVGGRPCLRAEAVASGCFHDPSGADPRRCPVRRPDAGCAYEGW